MHDRYAVEHGFLGADVGSEAVTIAQTVNAFFRWEFNSCEMLVKNGVVYPIDYANACPDVAVTSLHYYFPWAMKALLRWTSTAWPPARKPRTQVDTGPWFAVADDDGARLPGKLAAYQGLADDYFETERYQEFCATALPHVDEMVLEWVDSPDFARCCTRRSSRPTRRTSGSASRATSAGCPAVGQRRALPPGVRRVGSRRVSCRRASPSGVDGVGPPSARSAGHLLARERAAQRGGGEVPAAAHCPQLVEGGQVGAGGGGPRERRRRGG